MVMENGNKCMENSIRTASHDAHKQALLTLLKEFDRVCKALQIPYILFAGTMLGAVRHNGFIPWDDDLDVLMMRKDYERFLRDADSVLEKEKFYLQKPFSTHWPMFFAKLRLHNTACLEKYHPRDPEIHQGIYMDIFPCDRAAESAFGRKLQFCASKVVIAKSLDRRGYETSSTAKKIFMKLCGILPMNPFLQFVQRGREDSTYVHTFLAAASGYGKNVYPAEWFAETEDLMFEDGSYPVTKTYDKLLKTIYGDYMTLPPPEERVVKQHAVLVDTENSYEIYRDYHKNLQFETHTKSIR